MHNLGISQLNSYFNINLKNKTNNNNRFPTKTLSGANFSFALKPLTKDTVSFSGKSVEQPAPASTTIPNNYLTLQTIRKAVNRLTTNDNEVKEAIIKLIKNESIVIRTKEEAIPILKELYKNIKYKENLFILNINPQTNENEKSLKDNTTGTHSSKSKQQKNPVEIQKSNTLISEWYKEINGLEDNQLITLTRDEILEKSKREMRPCHLNPNWTQNTPESQCIIKQQKAERNNKLVTISEARNIVNDCQSMSGTEILGKYTIPELAGALNRKNEIFKLSNGTKGGYAKALAEQLNIKIREAQKAWEREKAEAEKNGNYLNKKKNISIVITDDCSLSGSSILTDSIKILNSLEYPEGVQLHVYFSPLILGDKAKTRISNFPHIDISANNEKFLYDIGAKKELTKQTKKEIKELVPKAAFKNIQDKIRENKITWNIATGCLNTKHYEKTSTFKSFDDTLKEKVKNAIQGKDGNYEGYQGCGVMVITPTEEFTIGSDTYAGKIPTNSVGIMEVVGHMCGVLNDAQGVFTKGSGEKYEKFSQDPTCVKKAEKPKSIKTNKQGRICLQNAEGEL